MIWICILFLFIGFVGGIITTLAGGAQFLTFPMLNIVAGLPARTANGTSSMAVWPSPLVSSILLGKNTSLKGKTVVCLIVFSVIGSCIGVLLVSRLSDNQFKQLFPFLLLIAASALTWGSKIRHYFNKPTISPGSMWLIIFQFFIAIYAGVYGGGVAIIMLAVYGFFAFDSLKASQQLKNLLAGVMNVAAACTFAFTGLVAWNYALPLMAGNIAGGIVGAHLLRSLNPDVVRVIVIVFAWCITAYYFIKLF